MKNHNRIKHSIRRQFALSFIGLLTATIVGCWFINNTFLEKYYVRRKVESINSAYETVRQAVSTSGLSSEEMEDFMVSSFENNIFAVVVDANSRMVFATPNGGEEFKNSVVFYRIGGYQVQPDTVEHFFYRSGVNKTEYLGRFGILEDGNAYLICTPLESIRDSVMLANRFLAYIGLTAIVVGGLLIWLITQKVTDPIQELAAISEKMIRLDFDARYHGHTRNEIEMLGDNMNQLAETLEKTISELKTANNELQRDIEKKEKVDQMRKEFLANVSHELKTPIALIQGYAEGLQDGITEDPEEMKFYCDVIVDEASKMNQMVKKLMTLNQLECGNDTVTMERFDIAAMIHSYLQSAGILTKQNQITVREVGESPAFVWGDEFKLEEVFMNYFSNAVNHCETNPVQNPKRQTTENPEVENKEAEKLIEVKIQEKDGKVRVSVFNTGKPIPEESIPRLWEKFYKVDKARTREYGGSGVGLSIVKAIMESMNGAYGVENYTNGVLFWFELEGA